jgi:hypothetical protein
MSLTNTITRLPNVSVKITVALYSELAIYLADIINDFFAMKQASFLFIFFMTSSCIFAQSDWSEKPSVSFDFTRISQTRYSHFFPNRTDELYKIGIGSIKFSAPATQKFRVGAEVQNIFTMVASKPRDKSFLVNVGTMYEFYKQGRLNMFAETGYSLTNLCTCGFAEQYRSDTLQHFWSLGVGANIKVYKPLHLTIGLSNYTPLTGRFPTIYRWVRPYVGVQYYLPVKVVKNKRSKTKPNIAAIAIAP